MQVYTLEFEDASEQNAGLFVVDARTCFPVGNKKHFNYRWSGPPPLYQNYHNRYQKEDYDIVDY